MSTQKKEKKQAVPQAKAPVKNEGTPVYETVVNWIVFAVYTMIVLYTTSCHEPWRDEAQSWLISRDCSLVGLFKYLPYEGHPPGLYLLQMPFAKLGFPYYTANIINNIIAIGAVWLILFKSRLPLYLRIAMVFSYYSMFEYAVMARNYSMVTLMLFAIVAFYKDRFTKPLLYGVLVFLLFETNALAFCAGVGIGALYFLEMVLEKRFTVKNFAALGIMVTGGLIIMGLLLFGAGMQSGTAKEATDKYAAFIGTFGDAMFLNKASGWGVVCYAIIALALFRKPKVLLFLAIALAGCVYISVFKYPGTLRHHGFILIFLISAYALAVRYEPLKIFEKLKWVEIGGAIFFSLLLLLQGTRAVDFIKADIAQNFSDSKDAAAFINEAKLDNYMFIGHKSYAASAILPYLSNHKPIWYADQQRYGTFVYLDTAFTNNYLKYSGDYGAYMAHTKFADKLDSIILINNAPLQQQFFLSQWELIFHSTEPPMKNDEAFFIYRHRADAPKTLVQ